MVKRLMLSMGLPSLRAQRREQLLPRVPERGARERRVDPDVFALRFLNIPCLVSGAGRSWGPLKFVVEKRALKAPRRTRRPAVGRP